MATLLPVVLMTIEEAARVLKISYMEALTDARLKKVRVNRYHKEGTKLLDEIRIEASGRYPMVLRTDVDAYREELKNAQ